MKLTTEIDSLHEMHNSLRFTTINIFCCGIHLMKFKET